MMYDDDDNCQNYYNRNDYNKLKIKSLHCSGNFIFVSFSYGKRIVAYGTIDNKKANMFIYFKKQKDDIGYFLNKLFTINDISYKLLGWIKK